VTLVSGQGTFTVPAALLPTAGTTTVTLTLVTSATSTCSAAPIVLLAADIIPTVVDEPTLIVDYNLCQYTNPTVANLTMIVSGTLPVVWYTALTGGTAYSATDLLVPGTTYYAAYVGTGGCESATRMPFEYVLTGCEVVIPDGFSPNDDGVNDTFEIANIGLIYPNFKIEIYNRYGNMVYRGDINTPNWAGVTTESGLKLGDNLVPTGVYFYIVYFNDGIKKPVQGSIYLSR
jgi:gliding motility-associated-like protein